MAQDVIINGVTYADIPGIQVPKSGGAGLAFFPDTSDATLESGMQMLAGVTAYSDGVKYVGGIPSLPASTLVPTTSDQTIREGQYVEGAQTIKGDANLASQNILKGVSIFGVAGSLSTPSISQDQTTKIVTIS